MAGLLAKVKSLKISHQSETGQDHIECRCYLLFIALYHAVFL